MTVFVGPSIYRSLDVRTATAMYAAMAGNPSEERVIWAPLWNDALIGRSRSLMTSKFLETDADVMVIIDDDIVFEWEDFWKLVEGARETKSVYGGLYVTRSTEPHITSRLFPGASLDFHKTPQRRPIEIQYLATGFWAMHRDLVEAMVGAHFEDADGGHTVGLCSQGGPEAFYPFFMPFQVVEDNGARHYLSEDWAFCNRARQLGYKVWADQSIMLMHMGLYPYTVADLKRAADDPGFPSTGHDLIEVQGRVTATGEPLVDSLIADIAEWAGEDEGDLRRMVALGPQKTSELFASRPDGQSEREWYEREDVGLAYIADLACWHLLGQGAWTLVAGDLKGRRILDFGCGIATQALIAARDGADMYCYEPNPVMREFAEWRADKHGLRLLFVDDPTQFADSVEPYDDIVVWHVFEHMEQPESALDALLRAMRIGGRLITESGFEDHLPAQHHHHDDWAGSLASRGLVEESSCVYVVGVEGGESPVVGSTRELSSPSTATSMAVAS